MPPHLSFRGRLLSGVVAVAPRCARGEGAEMAVEKEGNMGLPPWEHPHPEWHDPSATAAESWLATPLQTPSQRQADFSSCVPNP